LAVLQVQTKAALLLHTNEKYDNMTRTQDTLGKFYSSTQENSKSKTEQHFISEVLLQKLYVCNKKNCCFHYATKASHMHLTQYKQQNTTIRMQRKHKKA
jgi:hypothetical protein